MEKGEKRILKSPLSIRTSYSIGTIPAGEIIEIQQGKDKFGNVLIHNIWYSATRIESISELVSQ